MSTNPKNGRPDQFGEVDLENLHVDETYQRSIKMDLVQEIANDWRDEACGYILVSIRGDGSMWVVDGQHRVSAAKLIEKTHLPARVVTNHTAPQEAKLRLMTNRKRNETPADRFRAMLIAGYPEALSIVKILRSFKAKLALEGSRADSVTCISTIEKLWRMDKGATMRSTLAVIHEADGKLDASNVSARTLYSVQWFMDQHNGYDRKKLVKVLKQEKAVLKHRGDELHAMLGGSVWVNQYRALVERYNAGLAKAAQMEPMTRGYKSIKTGIDRGEGTST